jgi:valyl-tRNA synthetase
MSKSLGNVISPEDVLHKPIKAATGKSVQVSRDDSSSVTLFAISHYAKHGCWICSVDWMPYA